MMYAYSPRRAGCHKDSNEYEAWNYVKRKGNDKLLDRSINACNQAYLLQSMASVSILMMGIARQVEVRVHNRNSVDDMGVAEHGRARIVQ